jgi:hypothetical protein
MKQLFLLAGGGNPDGNGLNSVARLMVSAVFNTRDARGMWDRLIQIRGENTSRALAGADSVRPYLLKSKAPFLTA